jgi:hypothetical protein
MADVLVCVLVLGRRRRRFNVSSWWLVPRLKGGRSGWRLRDVFHVSGGGQRDGTRL